MEKFHKNMGSYWWKDFKIRYKHWGL